MSEDVIESADLLATIVAATRRTIEARQARVPLVSLAQRAEARSDPPGRMRAALSRVDRVNIIAECKRRSPSRGVLRRDYDPATIATGYAAAAAAAVSVLTEPTFFDGSLAHLRAVRACIEVPLLRKDFIVDEYQLWEARECGADAVLLIVAALSRRDLVTLLKRAHDLGLDALVEVHTAEELAIAVDIGATLVGVNNRNLRTLAVDVRASEMLAGHKPAGILAVSESGLKTPDDVIRLRGMGFDAFLMGERFMTELDPGRGLEAFLAATTGAGDRVIAHGREGSRPCS